MPDLQELKTVVEDIVTSYEKRIEGISDLFDTTHQILNDFQEFLLDNKEEREKINTQLRDILAKNEHLRRKDFDNMMQGILRTTEEREKKVRNLLQDYFNGQKFMAGALRENLGRFKDSLARGEAERVKESQALIKDILSEQEKRKEEVTSNLKEFQRQQKELAGRLRELLAKGNFLRIRDLKLMLGEFKAQREKRLALQEKRKEDVARMLDSFKKERQRLSSPSPCAQGLGSPRQLT